MRKFIYAHKKTFGTFFLIILVSNANANTDSHKFELLAKSECKQHEWTLLYAVALTESAKYIGSGKIKASPYAFNSPEGAKYMQSKEKAKAYMKHLTSKYKNSQIDVGAMQLNLKWNKHRVDDIEDLLDPRTNLKVACSVLNETIKSSPDDLEIGIGRYHAWTDKKRSRDYGKKVIRIWKNLNAYLANQ